MLPATSCLSILVSEEASKHDGPTAAYTRGINHLARRHTIGVIIDKAAERRPHLQRVFLNPAIHV